MKSPVWGNKDFGVTQPFGVNLPNVPDSWYSYVTGWGLPYGTHGALDIGMPNGTELYAPVAGTVIFAGENLDVFRPGYVEIEYKLGENTERFILGHMNEVANIGSTVTAGQYLGKSGEQTLRGTRTPDGSGPHLHAERRDITRTKLLDPEPILTGSKATPTGGGGSDRSNWPTADAIDNWTAKAGNGKSPLIGMGKDFIRFGEKYGINPGIVVAILQRESQMGADGSELPTKINNYAGITTNSGGYYFIDRQWKVFGSPRAGLEGVFQLLDDDLYRETGGRLADIMALYSPEYENDWSSMFRTFAVVGEALGITITRETNIYGSGGSASDGNSAAGLISFVEQMGPRVGMGALGVLMIGIGAVAIGSKVLPAGKIAGAVLNA